MLRAARRGPAFPVEASDDERACGGHLGLFESTVHPWRVTVCSELPFVPVHELAHAWIATHTDEPTRERYLKVRGKDAWDAAHLEWRERGVEDAAFVIQQNLTSNHTGALDEEWNSRAAAYELLTGTRSPLRHDLAERWNREPSQPHPPSQDLGRLHRQA